MQKAAFLRKLAIWLILAKRLTLLGSDNMAPLSREYLLARGKCCKLGCKNCPWNYKREKPEKEDDEE